MDREAAIFLKHLILGEDQMIFEKVDSAGDASERKVSYNENLSYFIPRPKFFDEDLIKNGHQNMDDFMSRYMEYKLKIISNRVSGQKKLVKKTTTKRDDDSPRSAYSLCRITDRTKLTHRRARRGHRTRQNFHGLKEPTLFFSSNGHRRQCERKLQRRWRRCLLCISVKKYDIKRLKNRKQRSKVLNNNVMCVLNRSYIIKECSLIDYQSKVSRPDAAVSFKQTNAVKDYDGRENRKVSSTLKKSSKLKQRRVGTVENPFSTELSIFRSIRNLIQHFSNLLDEKKSQSSSSSSSTIMENGSMEITHRSTTLDFEKLSPSSKDNSPANNCKKMQEDHSTNENDNVVDGNEEHYDQFKFIQLPLARATNKSPQSDEGIEPDPDRKRGYVARCWSLDSAVPSDDDSYQNIQQIQKAHKVRVTRCCSSDSAVLSDDDQNKAWSSSNINKAAECEASDKDDGQPRYWRTPSVVVSDFSDYSYLEEEFERSNVDEKSYGNSGPSQASSSCSCFDCDEIRESTENSLSLDFRLLQICRYRRHSDSCCVCISAKQNILQSNVNRRSSCLASPGPYYPKLTRSEGNSPNCESSDVRFEDGNHSKSQIELLDIPMSRKISDCSTNSSLSGDDYEITELQPVKHPKTSGWRKLRNIVQWTPFFQTYKKQRYPWVQLAGHQGNFRAGPTPGTILKKLCPQEEACFRLLMRDVLRPYIPEFKGVLDVREYEDRAEQDGELEAPSKDGVGGGDLRKSIMASYLQLQDLLGDFEQPCVMDCKIGVRTYLESELAKAKERPKLRKDMYEKMVQVDPTAPTAEERRLQGVTKPRYMVWRETISSTATLGFRVEGIKRAQGGSSKDFKTTRTLEQVTEALKRFTEGYPHAASKYLQRLKAIRATLKASTFFATHEVVGSSLLFVHDARDAGIWLIDFAKTLPLPSHLMHIRHDTEWQVGNHEDGYLIGMNNLIDIFQDIKNSQV